MTYFNNAGTLEELRKQYKELLKIHHPDNANGSEDVTKEINAEYDKLFKVLEDKHDTAHQEKTDNTESDYSKNMYDWENDKTLREVLQQIISLSGITINLVGAWIWLDGNTYPYKDALKDIGFKWSKQRKMWHWHNGEYIRKGNSKIAFVEIENKYGSKKFRTKEKIMLQA
ncbi:MAG: J domain-containing protein [Lachnospiraceae bacterium]|nr:J domain-containing protein [Lachnospiraceae bacterium]